MERSKTLLFGAILPFLISNCICWRTDDNRIILPENPTPDEVQLARNVEDMSSAKDFLKRRLDRLLWLSAKQDINGSSKRRRLEGSDLAAIRQQQQHRFPLSPGGPAASYREGLRPHGRVTPLQVAPQEKKRGRWQGFCFRRTRTGRRLPYICWRESDS